MKTDPEALQDLIDLMGERLHNEAYYYLKDPFEAEAAVNYAFFKLWNKAHMYTEDRPSLPYVLSVLRNYCRDVWRAHKRKPKPISLGEGVNDGAFSKDFRDVSIGYTEDLVIELALSKEDAEVARKICLLGFTKSELKAEGISAEKVRAVLSKLKGALTNE